jgi:hypothetical protein
VAVDEPEAAVVGASGSYTFSSLDLSLTPGQFTDPLTDPGWQETESNPSKFVTQAYWLLSDVPNPTSSQFLWQVGFQGGRPGEPGIYLVANPGSHNPTFLSCAVSAIADENTGTYSVSFNPACIGTPKTLYWAAFMQYDTDPEASSVSTEIADSAPEGFPLPELIPSGYWLFARDGGVFEEGGLPFLGSLGNIRLNAPIVAGAAVPNDADGYWMVGSDGGVFQFGNAHLYGSLGSIKLNKPIVAMMPTADGQGYWLVASDGGVFEFGNAHFYGSLGSIKLNQPIVGAAAMPNDQGYWLFAADGGVFEFGNAGFYGSLGNVRLNEPIVGGAADASGNGYWMAGADGGLFEFGGAQFLGSAAGVQPSPVSDIVAASPAGYRMVAQSGQVMAYGSQWVGEPYPAHLNQPIVAMGSMG